MSRGSSEGGRELRLLAPAKVNLRLRVLGRRDDGFHDLETLFQAVDLADAVSLRREGEDIRLEVRGVDLGPPEENLAYRAAEAFLEATEAAGGVRILLEKKIPAGAGLGGGSSDAAAVLKGLNALWGTPLTPAELSTLGARLGSDVPFFLGESPLAVGRGRGEELTPCEPLPEAHLVLALPPVQVATGAAYRMLDRARRGAERPDSDPTGRACPGTWEDVKTLAANDFQPVIAEAHPEVARSLEGLRGAGGDPVLLSGSGAACFGLFPHRGIAVSSARGLRERLGWPCPVVRTLRRFPPTGMAGG